MVLKCKFNLSKFQINVLLSIRVTKKTTVTHNGRFGGHGKSARKDEKETTQATFRVNV